ncbi:MAG: hypothetical protein O7E57_04620 [Gammaproteobacteria bacterium]|nr:hypothetical protein [Gammaproteobacteria bacterium]
MKLEAEIIYDSYLPDALQQALDYAGDDGFVASMPQLLHARANASYDNIIWNTWFTSNSEESVLTTPQGQRVVVAVHGGGIFATPERFRKLFQADVSRFCDLGFTGLFAGKIIASEAHDMLDGKLADGSEIPVFPFDEFKRGVHDLPHRYAIVIDFETARKSLNGYHGFDDLKDDPMMIVRAGGVDAAAAYLDKARNRRDTGVMGNWHPFNTINPEQAQTRVPILAGNEGGAGTEEDDGHLVGYDSEYGMGGDSSIHNSSMINIARYVAVAPRDVSTSVRYLPF